LTDASEIRDALIAFLEKKTIQNLNQIAVTKWLKAEPHRTKYPSFPFGWVEALLGDAESPFTTSQQIRDIFVIVVCDKNYDAEKAEDSVLSLAEAIHDALREDETIGGTVEHAEVSRREKLKLFEKENSLCYVKVTISTRRMD